jgi:hypothetical protein
MQRVGLIYLCTTAVLTLAACSSNQAGPEPAGNPLFRSEFDQHVAHAACPLASHH